MPPEKLKSTLTIAYALYLFSLIMPLCLIAGVIWAYVKRYEAVGTAYYDHYPYLIKTRCAFRIKKVSYSHIIMI